jgi:hypothetical protein
MLPYHYGRDIPVKEKNILLEVFEQVFLRSQVKVGTGIWADNAKHAENN